MMKDLWETSQPRVHHYHSFVGGKKKKKNQVNFYSFLHADNESSDRMIDICMHECCACSTAGMRVSVHVCVRSLCVLVQALQGEKAGCGISKIISLPDGKTSHIPFEVPHVIPCKGWVCVYVWWGYVCSETIIIGSRDTSAYANNSRNITLIQ